MSWWPTIPLGDICSPKQHPTISKNSLLPAGFPVFGANGPIGFFDKFTHEKPTIAITCRGATCGTINVTPARAYISGNAMALDNLDTSRVDIRFLAYALKARGFRDVISGSAQPQITRAPLLRVQVPLPPLTEQRSIANVLDISSTLQDKRRVVLAKLQTLAQSIFTTTFASTKVEVLTIRQLLERRYLNLHKDGNHGNFYPRADDFGPEGVPFFSAQNISDQGYLQADNVQRLSFEKARELKIGWIKAGDVLLAHNASVGKVAVYDGAFGEALIGTSLTAFRPESEHLDSTYLVWALRSTDFQRQLAKNMSQTTRNQVPITAQRDLSIAVPSIRAQKDFNSRVSQVEKLNKIISRSDREFHALIRSLQYCAFQYGP